MTNNFRDDASIANAPQMERKSRKRTSKAAPAQTPKADTTEKAPSQPQTKFRAIFHATVTPQAVEVKTASNGKACIALKGALVKSNKRAEHTATVMLFGKVANDLENKLTAGQPIDLALQRNGGTLLAIGEPWTKEQREAFKAERAQRQAA